MVPGATDFGTAVAEFHRNWIHAREQRLSIENEIRVCPFEWDLEALETVPGFSRSAGDSPLETLVAGNHWAVQHSDEFFAYRPPPDFELDGVDLRFTSPITSPYAENNPGCVRRHLGRHARIQSRPRKAHLAGGVARVLERRESNLLLRAVCAIPEEVTADPCPVRSTFTPQYSEEAIQPFRVLGLDHQVVELACGHHTIGDLPYALIDCYHVCAFIKKRLV